MTAKKPPGPKKGNRTSGTGEVQLRTPRAQSPVGAGHHKPGSPAWIESMERATRALEMRKGGASFQQIADACGYANKSSASRAVIRLLDSNTVEVAEHVRRLEAARLDTMFQVLWPRVLRGELLAVDRALRVMERRAQMLGTDAPIRIQQTVVTEEQMLDAIAKAESDAAALEAVGGSWQDDDNIEDAEIVEIHPDDE